MGGVEHRGGVSQPLSQHVEEKLMNIEKHNERVEKHYEHKIEATEARAEKREEHIEGRL